MNTPSNANMFAIGYVVATIVAVVAFGVSLSMSRQPRIVEWLEKRSPYVSDPIRVPEVMKYNGVAYRCTLMFPETKEE